MAFLVIGEGISFGQSSVLPATMPTSSQMPTAVPKSSLSAADRASHRAAVVYADGQLEVTASNSSLNQILREIARQTGMKITGGVNDERVFGKFGPAAPAEVLATLLDGTGSNIVLRESPSAAPEELVITTRGGGPTPPNPNASRDEDEAPVVQVVAPAPQPTYIPPQPAQLPFSAPIPTPAATSFDQTPQTPPPAGIVDAPTVAPATEPGTTPGPGTQTTGTSDVQSPNGVKTPEQIFQQLQQLRQQQPASPQ